MVRWQPPPPGTQNGELTGYKIRYRKAGRKGDAAEIITNQLFQLIEGRFKNLYKFEFSGLVLLLLRWLKKTFFFLLRLNR